MSRDQLRWPSLRELVVVIAPLAAGTALVAPHLLYAAAVQFDFMPTLSDEASFALGSYFLLSLGLVPLGSALAALVSLPIPDEVPPLLPFLAVPVVVWLTAHAGVAGAVVGLVIGTFFFSPRPGEAAFFGREMGTLSFSMFAAGSLGGIIWGAVSAVLMNRGLEQAGLVRRANRHSDAAE